MGDPTNLDLDWTRSAPGSGGDYWPRPARPLLDQPTGRTEQAYLYIHSYSGFSPADPEFSHSKTLPNPRPIAIAIAIVSSITGSFTFTLAYALTITLTVNITLTKASSPGD